jgi:TnsA endonuclease N terminal
MKYSQGKYVIKNVAKYAGNNSPTYRSSWEFTFMMFCDNNPSIVQWASEPLRIPYRNPFTGKKTFYVPDFLIVYMDKNGQQHTEIVEIKPGKEAIMERTKSTRDRAYLALNTAKWAAANDFCRQIGIRFRVVTESDIYLNTKK